MPEKEKKEEITQKPEEKVEIKESETPVEKPKEEEKVKESETPVEKPKEEERVKAAPKIDTSGWIPKTDLGKKVKGKPDEFAGVLDVTSPTAAKLRAGFDDNCPFI